MFSLIISQFRKKVRAISIQYVYFNFVNQSKIFQQGRISVTAVYRSMSYTDKTKLLLPIIKPIINKLLLNIAQ